MLVQCVGVAERVIRGIWRPLKTNPMYRDQAGDGACWHVIRAYPKAISRSESLELSCASPNLCLSVRAAQLQDPPDLALVHASLRQTYRLSRSVTLPDYAKLRPAPVLMSHLTSRPDDV